MLARQLSQRRPPAAVRQLHHRRFSASSGSESRGDGWSGSGYGYMVRRGVGIASRTISRWTHFIDFYEQGGFARGATDEARTRMFVLTCMPRSSTVDLFEFMTGATQAVRMVYGELYKDTNHYPEICTDNLHAIATQQVLDVLTHKPRRQIREVAVHEEPRKTRLVLKELELVRVGLLSVDYETKRLNPDEAKRTGYDEEEWLRMEVAYETIEHIVVAPNDNVVAIDDTKTFRSSFTWTFEANVSIPDDIEWRITHATDFTEQPALVKANSAARRGSPSS